MDLVRTLRYARRYRNWREITRAQRLGGVCTRGELRNGFCFEGPPGTNVSRLLNGVWFKECYSPAELGVIGPRDTVIDVGANIGAFAVYAASRTRGRVIAVEPHPENLEFLERNLRANGHERVTIVPCALSGRDGSARLHVMAKGVLHTLTDQGGQVPTIEVPTRSLPSLLGELGIEQVDLLKLDCEGAEGRILAGLGPGELKQISRIAMEFHDDLSSLSHAELDTLLRDAGFETRVEQEPGKEAGYLYAWRPTRSLDRS